MKLGKKILLLAALAMFATFVVGGVPAVAHDGHPDGHLATCWDIEKSASVSGQPVSALELPLGGKATVDYAVAVTKRDCTEGEIPSASVDVFDSNLEAPLAVHLFDPTTFHYSLDITAETCDPFSVENTAIVRNEIEFDRDTVTIDVTVACDGGCTLTQGYWKTHSEFGPAPYDNTWAQLPLGASTTFFLSGKTWFNVFWTPPAGGNAYYQLAHQYMAARLNILNGASAPASVTNAIASATSLFNTYTPTQIGALKGNNSLRQQFLSLAGTLASYNEGAIGPGHCDD